MTPILNGDNFRSVDAATTADILAQHFAMEISHPRFARPVEVCRIWNEPDRKRGPQTPEHRANASQAKARYHAQSLAKRLGLEVAEIPLYRQLCRDHAMRPAEALAAVLSERRSKS